MAKPPNNENGLTILEVIAVLVIVAIITALVIARYEGNPTRLFARTEVIKAHIRYAQARSMNTNDPWGISSDGNRYWLFNKGDEVNEKRMAPGEETPIVDIQQYGLQMSGLPGSFISFDDKGRPCSDKNGQTPIASDLYIIVSSGADSKTIIVTRNTGFIP